MTDNKFSFFNELTVSFYTNPRDFIDNFSMMAMYTRLNLGLPTHLKTKRFSVPILNKTNENLIKLLQNFNCVISNAHISMWNQHITLGTKKNENGEILLWVFIASLEETSTCTSLEISAYGDYTEVECIYDKIVDVCQAEGTEIITITNITRDGELTTKTEFLEKSNTKLAINSFYPWLTMDLNEYFEEFMKSDEPILFLFGPPGTAKSTFIRTLIHSKNYPTMLAYNKNIVSSPELLTYFYKDPAVILACEDIDIYLKDRENDENPLMSSLLNASDGIVSHKGKKIILSTNLPSLNKVDPALLRVGRCFDILEFRELTPSEAATILVDMGRPPRDFSKKERWTLAEVVADTNSSRQMINRFANKNKIGF